MNGMATTGKNLQMVFAVADQKGAYEIRPVAPSAPDLRHHTLLCSSAPRERMLLPAFPLASHAHAAAPFSALPVVVQQPTPRPARNYGGRDMRYRWLDDLKPWQVHQLHAADVVATQLALPLNTFVTVNYHGTFAGGAAMATIFKRAMKRMGQWLRDNGVRFAFVYVHENPDDAKPNTHILVHVPPRLIRAFKAKAGDWFDALDGGVHVQPRNDTQRRAKGLGTRLQYMAKGAPYIVCRAYDGYRAKGGQGPIPFKRAGVAQCLRPKAGFLGTIKNTGAGDFPDRTQHLRGAA